MLSHPECNIGSQEQANKQVTPHVFSSERKVRVDGKCSGLVDSCTSTACAGVRTDSLKELRATLPRQPKNQIDVLDTGGILAAYAAAASM